VKCSDCSEIVRPIVAIDIDGTLGDYHRHFLNFAEGYLDMKLPRDWDGVGDWEEHLGLTKEKYREVKLAYRQGGLKRTMPSFFGVESFTHTLKEHGAEIWITTTRPWLRLDNIDPDTREWIRRNRIAYDHMIYGKDKYSQLASLVSPERVVAVVDDLEAECEKAAAEFGDTVVFQMANDFNKGARGRFTTVTSPMSAIGLIVARIERWKERYGD